MVGNIFVIPAILLVVLYVKSRKTYVVHPKTGDSVVLITGCDSGIGNAAVQRLLKEGYYVISTVFTDQGEETLRKFAQGINANDRLSVTRTDITNDDSVVELHSFVENFLKNNSSKKLVALVNNAGIALTSPLEVQPMAQFRKQIDVNLTGHVHVAQKLTHFLRDSKGRIVNTVSVAGRCAPPCGGAYGASKFAMEAITNCQRVELSPWDISVSAIEPGFVRTPLVVNCMSKMDEIYNGLLPDAKTLYKHELERGKKTGKRILSYAIDPSNVANKIYHAISSPNPKTRYLVGVDAHIVAFLVWFLPDRMMDGIHSLLNNT